MSATIVFDEHEVRVAEPAPAPGSVEIPEVDREITFEPFEERVAVPALHKHNGMLSNPVVWGDEA